jgi:hypothetical protein
VMSRWILLYTHTFRIRSEHLKKSCQRELILTPFNGALLDISYSVTWPLNVWPLWSHKIHQLIQKACSWIVPTYATYIKHFNIILPFTPMYHKWYLLFKITNYKFLEVSISRNFDA